MATASSESAGRSLGRTVGVADRRDATNRSAETAKRDAAVTDHPRFTDRTVLITGDWCNIGRAIALRLAAEAAVVAALDASLELATGTTSEVEAAGSRVTALAADARPVADLDRVLDAIDGCLPPPALLAHCAGSPSPWRRTLLLPRRSARHCSAARSCAAT
jgi:short chain dehydrogenase